jgi:hypothetical protein
LLVVANTHPLFSLVCQQLPYPLLVLPPFHTHRSSYNIYIDDINNTSHTRLAQDSLVNQIPDQKEGVVGDDYHLLTALDQKF